MEVSKGVYCLFLGIINIDTGILSSFFIADVRPAWALPGHNDKSISHILSMRFLVTRDKPEGQKRANLIQQGGTLF